MTDSASGWASDRWPRLNDALDVARGFRLAVLLLRHGEAAGVTRLVRGFSAARPESTVHVYDSAPSDCTAHVAIAKRAYSGRELSNGKGCVVGRMFVDEDAGSASARQVANCDGYIFPTTLLCDLALNELRGKTLLGVP